jgi:hypothetical protein
MEMKKDLGWIALASPDHANSATTANLQRIASCEDRSQQPTMHPSEESKQFKFSTNNERILTGRNTIELPPPTTAAAFAVQPITHNQQSI